MMADDTEQRGLPNPLAVAKAVSDRLFTFDAALRIVWANPAFRLAFGEDTGIVGRTLCEVLRCRHAGSGPGCGSAPACDGCGWLQSAAASLRGCEARTEVRVLTRLGGAFDFGVTTVALRGEDAGAVGLCALQDLANQKRQRVLERCFFHDVTNFAAGIRGLCEIIADMPGGPDAELMALLRGSAEKMMGEIQRLRLLRMAENGDLVAAKTTFLAGDLLRGVVAHFADETAARRLEVSVADGLGNRSITSDRDLLFVALCDVFQNAVEASGRGERVSLSCRAADGEVVFSVGNSAVLSGEVSAHLFERSFTTRGAGKGVGAYRAKLLCESHLDGNISVSSGAPEGTVVSIALRSTPESASG